MKIHNATSWHIDRSGIYGTLLGSGLYDRIPKAADYFYPFVYKNENTNKDVVNYSCGLVNSVST
jgi:hypothetical protein